jgi:hypothetical protein
MLLNAEKNVKQNLSSVDPGSGYTPFTLSATTDGVFVSSNAEVTPLTTPSQTYLTSLVNVPPPVRVLNR